MLVFRVLGSFPCQCYSTYTLFRSLQEAGNAALPGGQKDEILKISKKQCSFRNGGKLGTITFFPERLVYFIRRSQEVCQS